MQAMETPTDAFADVAPPASTQPAARKSLVPGWLSHGLRYTGVNIAACILDVSVFLLLNHLTALPTVSSSIGYTFGIVLNYHLTKAFVFHGHATGKSGRRLFMEFMGTGLVGLALTAGMTAFGVHGLALTPELSKAISLLACFVVLYFVRRWLVFRPMA